MALFGSSRDVSFIRKMNRELMGNIISQECAFYKLQLAETKVNMYGEASNGKFYNGPVLLNALITVEGSTSPTNDFGVNFDWPVNFAFLRDDLIDINLVPEVGDVILYQETYWEIDNTNARQFWVGKDPAYPYNSDNGTNPLNPGLDQFGYNVSIICDCHYVPADRVNLQRTRLL
jgi:hypothetical protein